MTWTTVVVAGVGCYVLKLAGLSVPASVLERPVVRSVAGMMVVALISYGLSAGCSAVDR